MKKILCLLLFVTALVACENDTVTSDPGLQAVTNNEEYSEALKYEKWKPNHKTAYVANENVLYIMGETDSTSYVMKVPYSPSLFGKTIRLGKYRKVIDDKASNKDDAYAYYRLKNKSALNETFAFYSTQEEDKKGNIVDMGEVSFAPESEQIPGTITGTFYVNMLKEPLDEIQQKNYTDKQKQEHAALRSEKIFQEGVFYRIPFSLPK
ncbi:DUF6252 family protein [Myroides pelagicus]|uniref:Lipoprotein n=1 Tax=Myroides pelagicus TaxID=270914 RepID=A0A7K1GJ94_9FLAO|nr:DUF6252 family protein [Myroides pelagicus]MEC4113040.1 DUF6252 family protein [Myroides pelagicus]MTH28957.1 hypothetical protein [Myroides pelagicus]